MKEKKNKIKEYICIHMFLNHYIVIQWRFCR